MEKSYVSMAKKICRVCGDKFDSGEILLDKRLRASMEKYTVTGWGICPEHQKLHDDGYVAMIGCDKDKSELNPDGSIKPESAYRTGSFSHVRVEAFEKVFDTSVPEKLFCFCEQGVLDHLKKLDEGSRS